MSKTHRNYPCCCGCSLVPLLTIAAFLGFFSAIYFFAPGRTNLLILGIDQTAPGSDAGRSDTNILVSLVPTGPYVRMLSIPRDLWVTIPGIGENRINTAHFFAEAAAPGSGPAAAMQTVQENFGVEVSYYVRIKFEGFREVFNALGGVEITLDEPMAGYEAGTHSLTGRKALAFARNRSGSDDFQRMNQGQIILKAAFRKLMSPVNWVRLPTVGAALFRSVDSNLPVWLWPRLGLTLLRVGPEGIDNHTVGREMVTPTTTEQGAAILLPKWDQINPLLFELFEQ
jgi:LCP family protein required for cell wall assembly